MMKVIPINKYPLPDDMKKLPYKIYSVKKVAGMEVITPGEADEYSDIIIYKNQKN